MGLFDSKTKVESYEKGFNTKRMEDRDVFHELNIRGEDPELLRTDILELVEDMNYDIIINKFTKFEDAEFGNIFRAGRLKPLRAVMLAEKRVETGSYFSFLWRMFSALGVLLLIAYFLPQSFYDKLGVVLSKEHFLMGAVLSMALAMLLWYVRRIDKLTLWIKASGIYDAESEKSDFRLLLSASSSSKKREALKKLEDDVSEIFRTISAKYVKRKSEKKALKIQKSKNLDINIIKEINDVDSDIRKLNSRFANGEISEDTYLEVKQNLIERKNKLETILDLLNV